MRVFNVALIETGRTSCCVEAEAAEACGVQRRFVQL